MLLASSVFRTARLCGKGLVGRWKCWRRGRWIDDPFDADSFVVFVVVVAMAVSGDGDLGVAKELKIPGKGPPCQFPEAS